MNDKFKFLIISVSLLALASAVYFFPVLPDKIPTHWEMSGEIDQYSSKWLIFVFALLPIAVYAIMGILPKIDPKKESYLKHQKAYETTRIATFVFMTGIYVLTLLASFGYDIKMDMIIKFGIGALFILIGNVLSQARHNYFFGIKTPWTLANETVWNKTHRVGAYSFVIMGLVNCTMAFISGIISGYIFFASIMIGAGYPVVYSYIQYKKIQKEK